MEETFGDNEYVYGIDISYSFKGVCLSQNSSCIH